ncbi:MAG: thioredoxin domain-containing protein [Candidatus Buchananbacteria bacterium]
MYSDNVSFDQPNASRSVKASRQKRWYQYWWGRLILAILTLLAVLFIAVGFYLVQMVILLRSGQVSPAELFNQTTATSTTPKIFLANADDPRTGQSQAKVVIVEFADFTCSACREAYPVIKQLIRDYGDKVLFVYRDFPAVADRPLSLVEAVAGNCAQEQGKFWEMHDLLFETVDDLTEEQIKTYAIKLGLNSVQFGSCLTSEKYLPAIEKDLTEGYQAGVRATPTFFINGQKVAGALPFSVFEKIITTELSK